MKFKDLKTGQVIRWSTIDGIEVLGRVSKRRSGVVVLYPVDKHGVRLLTPKLIINEDNGYILEAVHDPMHKMPNKRSSRRSS